MMAVSTVGPVHTKKRVRLVVLIYQTTRHQKQTGAQAVSVVQAVFHKHLLHRHLARIAAAGHGVFDFQLGHHFGFFIKAMLVANYEAGDVGLRGRAVFAGFGVVDFAVGAELRG
jgi:hypothetical protein